MNRIVVFSLAAAFAAACSHPSPDLVSPEFDAMLASVNSWTPQEITRDLNVDDSTRARIADRMAVLHKSMLELHSQHVAAGAIDGETRAESIALFHAQADSLHKQHAELWADIDPGVRKAIHDRLQDVMASHHEPDALGKLHEHMQKLHGSGH